MTISLEEVGLSGAHSTSTRSNIQEQHGEDELNDVGANVTTLDEEVPFEVTYAHSEKQNNT